MMFDLLQGVDPAASYETDQARLRAKVNERIGISAPVQPTRAGWRRPWLVAVAAFGVVLLALVPALLKSEPPSIFAPSLSAVGNLPGVDNVVPLASGGVQTTAVDGDTLWAMTALAHTLQRVSASSGLVEETYSIDAYVEGVTIGGGYVWLSSYDNGGEVLRFDPGLGEVDRIIPIGGEPWYGSAWFANTLWVGTQQDQTVRISTDGEFIGTLDGQLKGSGLGYHWIADPQTGVISSLGDDGVVGETSIPTESPIRSVTEAGGYLWLLDGDIPNGANVTRFDPGTGELLSVPLTFGLLGMTGFDGQLWVTSNRDHMLMRVDPATGDVTRFPLPGKPGGVFDADGSLWVTLYHPGALVRLDTEAPLLESPAPIVNTLVDGHRFICTGAGESGSPTIILQPMSWIDYGSWSVIQAELSNRGLAVCASGYTEEGVSPERQAADLEDSLADLGISGPLVLVANGDGVHATRLFADGRSDIAGAVLVDPMPVGFKSFFDEQLGTTEGHPPWLDLDQGVSDSLGDFGGARLVVIEHDPLRVFQSKQFIDYAGQATAARIDDYWRRGLDFYAGLSTNSTRVVAGGTGLSNILWDRSDLVVQQVLDVAGTGGG